MRFPAFFQILACLVPLAAMGEGKELEGERAAATTSCPSPEDARALMSVPDGYEVRCFAHEPMVMNPVAMTWDNRGRLWVVEAYEYPEGFDGPAPFGGDAEDDHYHPMPKLAAKHPRDRVIILEDTDHDGVADKRTLFIEGLNLASAIICGDHGIYVGQQPHLLHFRDEDGDDKPDAWRVCLTGFAREDTHELLNSFGWGPDGWLYMTHGVFTNSKVRRPGEPADKGFKFDAGLGRARPASKGKEAPWEFEVFADGTSNPWGSDYDAAGNYFCSACVIDHFFHLAPGGIYVRQGGAPENPYSYEQLPSIVKHRHFRAAYAGVQIYQGGVYPKDTWGHAFIGNIHDNAIHEEILTPDGATFKCEPRRDFVRGNNGWFRPVSTQTGPDGVLWIMDWCDKYPCYQNAKANPEGVDRERGRIWRIVPAGMKESASSQNQELALGGMPDGELVKALESSNSWVRRMARKTLSSREHAADAKPALEALIATSKSPNIVLEALWTLHQSDLLDADLLDRLASNAAPEVRAWSARLSGERFRLADRKLAGVADADVMSVSDQEKAAAEIRKRELDRLLSLAKDSDVTVLAAVAAGLRMASSRALTADRPLPGAEKHWRPLASPLGAIAALAESAGAKNDPLLSFSVWMALEPELARDPAAALLDNFPAGPPGGSLGNTIAYKAMRRLCDTRQPENLDVAVRFCAALSDREVTLAHALDGLVKGQEGGVIKPGKGAAQALAAWRASTNADIRRHAQDLAVLWGDEAAVNEMLVRLLDSGKPDKERISILQSVRQVRTDAVRNAVKELLGPTTPASLTVAAIRVSADLGGDAFLEPLLALAGARDFSIRNAALEALAGREKWTNAMLDAIAAGKIGAAGFPAPVRRQLATSDKKSIRDHAFRVLGAWKDSSEDVKSLIAQKKQACLTGVPNLANGKVLFTATCMVCHSFYGGGQKVGPDLIGSGRSNLDAILANVIDPNQIIGNGYENIVLTTKDGRSLAGRVIEDTPTSVKLIGAGGVVQTLPADQIAKRENTKQSLMPMGFGNLPDEAFRDLIWYVLAPPDEGPLTPQKKDVLTRGVEESAVARKPRGTNWRAIDWEAISLWNPEWKVSAPDFERTPVKLADYYGRSNVLLLHPFPDKKTPASFERKIKVGPGSSKIVCEVAADDRGDWKFAAVVDGQVAKEAEVGHDKPRWKTMEVDLSPWQGKEVTVRLESRATGWSMEFAYWHGIKLQ